MLMQEVLGECKAIVSKEKVNISGSPSQHVKKNEKSL